MLFQNKRKQEIKQNKENSGFVFERRVLSVMTVSLFRWEE